MHNSFHGRTLATIATGQAKYQEGFGPIPHGFVQVPLNDIEALKTELSEDVAAIILEPIQGEGGIRPADQSYLQEVKDLCDKHDIVLIFDEIQSGIARTGKWFAKDLYGIQPDIMTLAKGLGGGMPIGAFLCNEKIASAIQFGDHGTTFGGNPLATAAALATLQVIVEEGLLSAAKTKGNWLKDQLNAIRLECSLIKEVRGEGLMLGVELNIPTADLVQRLLKAGFIANATAINVLRLVPPLNIPMEDLEKFIEVLREEIKKIETEQK